MCYVTFQAFILLMNTIVTKTKIYKNKNVDISNRNTLYKRNRDIIIQEKTEIELVFKDFFNIFFNTNHI